MDAEHSGIRSASLHFLLRLSHGEGHDLGEYIPARILG